MNRSMSMNSSEGRTSGSSVARLAAVARRSRNSSRLGSPDRLSWTALCSSRSCARLASVVSRTRPTQRRLRRSAGWAGSRHRARTSGRSYRRGACGTRCRSSPPPRSFIDHSSSLNRSRSAGCMWATKLSVLADSSPALRPSVCLDDGAHLDLVAAGVPFPHRGAGAVDRQRAQLLLAGLGAETGSIERKAYCVTVKPISTTISTRPAIRLEVTKSPREPSGAAWRRPRTARPGAASRWAPATARGPARAAPGTG